MSPASSNDAAQSPAAGAPSSAPTSPQTPNEPWSSSVTPDALMASLAQRLRLARPPAAAREALGPAEPPLPQPQPQQPQPRAPQTVTGGPAVRRKRAMRVWPDADKAQ
jgi:hypothetical protein